MRALNLLFRVLVCLVLGHATSSLAAGIESDHVVSREVFRDTTGKMSLSEVTNASFIPSQDILAGGYTKDVVWMRLVVRPTTDGSTLVLRILPTYLNEITLYEPAPDRPGIWRAAITGNGTPGRNGP